MVQVIYPTRFFMLAAKVLLLLIFLFAVYGVSAEKLSYSFKNKTLLYVLEKIGRDNGVKIAFDAQLAGKLQINGSFVGKSVNELLGSLLDRTTLESTVIGNVFVIKLRLPNSETIQTSQPFVKAVEHPKFKIWGAVTDVESGERLPYAYIYTEDGQFSTTANADGFFSLTLDSGKPLVLCVSYLGFLKRCVDVSPDSKAAMLMIPLDKVQTVLQGIVIAERHNYLVQIPQAAGKNTLNPRASSDVPSINPLDFTAPLQMLPGIDATTESSVGLNVRKSPGDQTLVLFDGFTVYHLNHFLGQLSAFNTKAIKDIQVYKGGFDARYGGAASAILEITGKSGNKYQPNFTVGADLLSVDASADVPLTSKLSVVMAVRRSYTDVYQTSLYSDLFDKLRGNLASTSLASVSSFQQKYNPDYYYYDLHGKITYMPDSAQTLSLSVYSGNDNMDLSDSRQRASLVERSRISNLGVGLMWSKQFGSKYYLRASSGYSGYLLDFNHQNVVNAIKEAKEISRRQMALDNHISDFTSKVEYEARASSSVSIFFGGVYTNVHSGYSYRNYRDERLNIEIDTLRTSRTQGNTLTGYSLINIAKGRMKLLSPGVRITYFSPAKKIYLEPRLDATFAVADKLDLKFAAGRYLQFVNRVPISYLGDYSSYWVVADGNTHPVVKSNHLIGGFTYNATPNLQFDVEGYLKKTSDMATLSIIPVISNQKLKMQQKLFYSDANIRGIDIFGKYLFPKGQLALAYSFSSSDVKVYAKKETFSYPSSLDQLHELKIFASRKFWHLNFSAAWIYGSGKPWSELAYSNVSSMLSNGQRNNRRLPDYHRLDASVSYEQNIGKTRLTVVGNIFNVYNRDNVMKRPYSLSDTPLKDFANGKSPFVYDDINGFGFTPTLYLSLSF